MLPSFVRLADLKARKIANSRQQVKNLQRRHGFPIGRLIGATRCWTEQELEDWLASRPIEPLPRKGIAATLVAKARAKAEAEASA